MNTEVRVRVRLHAVLNTVGMVQCWEDFSQRLFERALSYDILTKKPEFRSYLLGAQNHGNDREVALVISLSSWRQSKEYAGGTRREDNAITWAVHLARHCGRNVSANKKRPARVICCSSCLQLVLSVKSRKARIKVLHPKIILVADPCHRSCST